MRLGAWIETLEGLPAEDTICVGPLNSYRGYYDNLALYFGEQTVAEALADAIAADGGTFEGYKGGEYVMNRHTPVWFSDYGDCSRLGISGVSKTDGKWKVTAFDASDYGGF